MSGALDGKAVMITGAAGGIGSAITEAFLRADARVIAIDLSEAVLAPLVSRLTMKGLGRGTLLPLETDVSDQQACASAIESAIETFGRLDALVNNAALGMGVVRNDHMTNLVATEELSPTLWDRFISVNLSGAWYLSYHAFPHMRERGHCRVINVSTSFFTMLRPGFQPYGPAKAAMEAMSASHAAEFAGSGITVNVVVPGGPADTPMVPAEAPFKRDDLVAPERMFPPMAWLIGEAGDDVTGQRYIAADWDPALPATVAATAAGAPAAWPGLAQNPVWPGGKPEQ